MVKKCSILLFSLFIFSTSIAMASPVQDAANNKRLVIAFYNKAINQKDFAAASQYLGQWYTQHNPKVNDGAAGLQEFIAYLKAHYPQAHGDIKRVFAEGEYVVLHVHSMRAPGDRGRAIVDIFRLENHKIVEHWDVIQDIPEISKNQNGMF